MRGESFVHRLFRCFHAETPESITIIFCINIPARVPDPMLFTVDPAITFR